jgi:cytochrome c peroxidase
MNNWLLKPVSLITLLFVLLGVGLTAVACQPRAVWSEGELVTLRGLWLDSLPPLPPDPSNPFADNPLAAELGHKLFFDTRFSSNGQVACATCHLPELDFQDGTPLAQGVGVTDRRTMPLAGVAYSSWFFWDGRKDSLWAQALGPLENPVEHGGNRTQYAHLIAAHYRPEYETLFGPLPDLSHLPPSAGPVEDAAARAAWEAMSMADRELVSHIYVNMGKAIAAYQRLLQLGPSRFDEYVTAVLANDWELANATLTADEIAGLRLFIGKGNCIDCHNGPLFTNNDFHNTGVPAVIGLPEDVGRALGAQQLLADEFNCLSVYSDADPTQCVELRFLVAEGHNLVRQYKPPSLRNVAERPPYMHAGQIGTLADVVAHYNRAPAAPAGHSELEPLNLNPQEMAQLIAFLRTLSGPLNTAPAWLQLPLPVDTTQ